MITQLLEKYGQGGPCSQDSDLFYYNSFMIADNKVNWVSVRCKPQSLPWTVVDDLSLHHLQHLRGFQEAYVLETADQFWAAEKVSSGYRNISNSLSIGTNFELSSEGLKEKAQAAGLWDGSGDFDFSKVFSDGEPAKRYEAGKKLLETYASGDGK